METELFEDKVRAQKQEGVPENQYSPYCDLIYYPSTVTPGLTLAMRVRKPAKPSYIVATTHGWHMSISPFCALDAPQTDYLSVEVDMRGRAFSTGRQDCNGWEIFDVIDAVEYVKAHYAAYILDPSVVCFAGGSGGGGNAFAIAGKFPDYFTHITATCGISDYALWYRNDLKGEFRDEMDVWIGSPENEEAYRSRSGLTTVQNLCAPMAVAHGETDIRVPCYHSRRFVRAAREQGKAVSYLELPLCGAQDHFSYATPEQMRQLDTFCKSEREAHLTPVSIPRRGRMIVAGYLFTKAFSVVLDSIDRVAAVEYDLDRDTITVDAPAGTYTVTRR